RDFLPGRSMRGRALEDEGGPASEVLRVVVLRVALLERRRERRARAVQVGGGRVQEALDRPPLAGAVRRAPPARERARHFGGHVEARARLAHAREEPGARDGARLLEVAAVEDERERLEGGVAR